MTKAFIVGAAGEVRQRLVRLPADRGHEPTALHRTAGQADQMAALGAAAIAGDPTRLPTNGAAGTAITRDKRA